MGDLKTCPPEQFMEAFDRYSLDEKRTLIEDLGTRPSERSVRILAEILQGSSWHLRDLAVRAMARMGEPAVPTVTVLLYSGLWYTRAAAARTLGRMGHTESLPGLVLILSDSNHTVQEACLASIADLVRGGQGKETARLFWNQGARRAEELNRMLLAVHPDAGNAVGEFLSDPSSFLREDMPEEEHEVEAPEVGRKNA